jgi:hypothetical protein
VRSACALVLVLTGVGVAVTYVPFKTDSDEIPPHFLQYVKGPPESPESADEAVEGSPVFPAPIVVTVAQRRAWPAVPPEPRSSVSKDRATIGRQLQTELKRVGCYDGDLNGAWTRSTREAMRTFLDRVNARLPIDEPDGVLLALVQASNGTICGERCPPGQGLSHAGECLPNAILARTTGPKSGLIAAASPAARATPAIVGWTTTVAGAQPIPPADVLPTEPLAAPPSPTVVASTPRVASPSAAEKRRSRHAEREGDWARSLFRQLDRIGVN